MKVPCQGTFAPWARPGAEGGARGMSARASATAGRVHAGYNSQSAAIVSGATLSCSGVPARA